MSSNGNTLIPTQQSVKAYVDTQVTGGGTATSSTTGTFTGDISGGAFMYIFDRVDLLVIRV